MTPLVVNATQTRPAGATGETPEKQYFTENADCARTVFEC